MKKSASELRKKSITIIIVYSIFVFFVVTLSLLKKYSIINSNFYLIPFYFVLAIITYSIIIILYSKMEKIYHKKVSAASMILSLIGIFLLVFYGTAVDLKKESIDFSKNATKIDAFIYKDIEKNITKHTKHNCNGVQIGNYCYVGDYKSYNVDYDYYQLEYIYHLRYIVNDEEYTSIYSEKESKEFSSELAASKYNQAKYKKGDYITIYYDNDNPENIKGDFSLSFGMIYFFEIIIILFQLYYFIKHKKIIREMEK